MLKLTVSSLCAFYLFFFFLPVILHFNISCRFYDCPWCCCHGVLCFFFLFFILFIFLCRYLFCVFLWAHCALAFSWGLCAIEISCIIIITTCDMNGVADFYFDLRDCVRPVSPLTLDLAWNIKNQSVNLLSSSKLPPCCFCVLLDTRTCTWAIDMLQINTESTCEQNNLFGLFWPDLSLFFCQSTRTDLHVVGMLRSISLT